MGDPRLDAIVSISPVPEVTVTTIRRALDSVRRIIVCSLDVEEQLRADVEKQGLSAIVEVVGTRFLDPRTAYIVPPSALHASPPNGSWTQTWLDDYERTHPR